MGTIFILNLLKKYWLYLLIPILIASTYFYTYNKAYKKGQLDCQVKIERTVYVEVEKRHTEEAKEVKRIDSINAKIKKSRETRPIDDDRDSCLLSNDPYETECVK